MQKYPLLTLLFAAFGVFAPVSSIQAQEFDVRDIVEMLFSGKLAELKQNFLCEECHCRVVLQSALGKYEGDRFSFRGVILAEADDIKISVSVNGVYDRDCKVTIQDGTSVNDKVNKFSVCGGPFSLSPALSILRRDFSVGKVHKVKVEDCAAINARLYP